MKHILTVMLVSTAATLVHAEARIPEEEAFLGCSKYPEKKQFRWSVRGEVGVAELTASLSELSCRPIVVAQGIAQRGGKVSLRVPDLITAPEAWRLFVSSLEAMGLTVETVGKLLKVVDAGRGREVSRPLPPGEATPGSDQFVTRLLRVEHHKPQDVAEVLARIKSKEGEVTAYAPGGSLVVTDRATNVRRMEALLATLDVPRTAAAERLFALQTHAQSPSELAGTLEKILAAGRRAQAPSDGKSPAPSETTLADGVTALVPVDAARLVVMIGSEPGWRRVMALAARLDPIADENAGGQAHVVYLAHTNAEDMAATLKEMGLGGKPPGRDRPPGAELKIGADKVSNAIVVFGASADFLMVRDLVAKLDVPRRQVYVETYILDVSAQKLRDLGLAFHSGASAGSGTTALVSSSGQGFNTLTLDAQTLAGTVAGGGLLTGVIGQSFEVAGMSIPSFGVILKALEHSRDVNVISKPHLLTMDNAKATLSVGQQFPYQQQSLSAAGITGVTSTVYKDVELKLSLTPHLNESASVRLEIDGEISDVPDGGGTLGGAPITNKRTIKTAVVVRDGETVVLGGLQKESLSETVDKIPFIGDIPVLGRLFQTRSKQRTKQDLLIVMTPYVIRGPEDLRRIYERKECERREFIERTSAFKNEAAYDASVDYRRKRGLLQEVNLAALEAEREVAALRQAERAIQHATRDGPIGE